MKKFATLILAVVCLFALTSCGTKPKKPNAGKNVESIDLKVSDGSIVTITKDTSPEVLYNIMKENLDLSYCYQFKIKIKQLYSDSFNYTYKGYFSNNYGTQLYYYEIYNNLVGFNQKNYSNNITNQIVNITTRYNKNFFGGISSTGGVHYIKNNKGVEMPLYFDKNNEYFKNVNPYLANQLSYIEFAIQLLYQQMQLEGVYYEGVEGFDYDIKLTNKYIIFSVKQEYGLQTSNLEKVEGFPTQKYETTVYFNTETYQFDYIKTSALLYVNTTLDGKKLEYTIVMSLADEDVINNKMADMVEFGNANGVDVK